MSFHSMQTLIVSAILIASPTLLVSGQSAVDQTNKADGPRKVVLGTVIHPMWDFTSQERRINELETLLDEMASRAVEKHAKLDLAILPEEILTLGSGRSPAERAVALNGPEVDRIRDKAREHETYIVLPLTLIAEEADDRFYNAAILLDRKGETVGVYRKVHPVAAYDTTVLEGGITPGSDFPVFDCDFGKLGILICWDMSFADGWERLADAGAEIVAVPSASPQTVRPAAHALQGNYYVVTSTPRTNATVFNPLGRIAAQITEPGVLVHQIDLAYVRLHWSPNLRNGALFRDAFGDRIGFSYYHDEDAGIFWSNDPALSIRQVTREFGELEMLDHVERTRRLQNAARPD